MRSFLAIIGLALLTACTTLPSATSATRTVIVDGEATIYVMPDTFIVSATLVSKNPDQAAGLAELSAKLAQVKEELPRLAGLKHLQINSGDIHLSPIYDSACMREAGYGTNSACPTTGRIGAVGLQIQGGPADRAGQIVSLLSQFGAETVELQSFSLSNMKTERDRAIAAAVEDARTKALAIAQAAGAKVAGLEKVQYGGGFDADRGSDAFSIMSAWNDDQPDGGIIVPTVNLDITPSPIEVRAKVVASFAVQ